jgi:protein SCO1/2
VSSFLHARVVPLLVLAAVFAPGRSVARADTSLPPILENVDIEEHIGRQLPLDVVLRDSEGKERKLGEALHPSRPSILTLVYYDCPMLCSLVQSGLVAGLAKTGWTLGKDYDLLTVSFNPADKMAAAAERRRGYLQALGASDLGDLWPFFVAPPGHPEAVKQLADTVGFHYNYDADTKTFAHAAAVYVLTPDGKISRYLYGVEFQPSQLRLALTEAGGGKVGSSFEKFLLTCYHYNPASRRYALFITNYFRVGGALLMLLVGGLVGFLIWNESRRTHRGQEAHAK